MNEQAKLRELIKHYTDLIENTKQSRFIKPQTAQGLIAVYNENIADLEKELKLLQSSKNREPEQSR